MTRRISSLSLYICFVATILTLTLGGCDRTPPTKTPYQVVLLDNGQAYFGKIESMTTFLLLTDIYYVQTQASPEGKPIGNVLLKRGKEWHGPDRMYVNTSHVVMIEPVAPDSKVAQLIKEEKAKSSAEPSK